MASKLILLNVIWYIDNLDMLNYPDEVSNVKKKAESFANKEFMMELATTSLATAYRYRWPNRKPLMHQDNRIWRLFIESSTCQLDSSLSNSSIDS